MERTLLSPELLSPVLKWVGGKTQFIEKILDRFPPREEFSPVYIEPFLGGGSVLFAFAPPRAIVSDVNPHLINFYQRVKEDPEDLIAYAREKINSKEAYLAEREEFNRHRRPKVEEAASFYYLNRTCFRGLYRENSKGEFNVPYGNYKSFDINAGKLKTLSEYFSNNEVDIVCCPYQETLSRATPEDFVYLDPPYYPEKSTQFTKYSAGDFTPESQAELAAEVKALPCHFLLSNSPHPEIIRMYQEYRMEIFTARRAISVKQGQSVLLPNEILIWSGEDTADFTRQEL